MGAGHGARAELRRASAKSGLGVVRIDGIDVTSEALEQTRSAMRRGAKVIVQARAVASGLECGRADILRRVEAPSDLGGWSYEADRHQARARNESGNSPPALSLFADLLEQAQGLPPEYMYVSRRGRIFEPQQYRFADYAAYFRKVKRALCRRGRSAAEETKDTYPDPIEHCDICRWRETLVTSAAATTTISASWPASRKFRSTN